MFCSPVASTALLILASFGPQAKPEKDTQAELRKMLAEAKELGAHITPEHARAMFLEDLAAAEAAAGAPERAVKTLAEITDHYKRTLALGEAAKTQALAGDPDGGLRLLKRAPEILKTGERDFRTANGGAWFSVAWARCGDLDGALERFGERRTGMDAAFVYQEFALVAIEKGDLKRAIKILEKIPQKDRGWKMSEVADRLLAMGDVASAAAVAEKVREPYLQGPVLAKVAEAYAKDGKETDAMLLHRIAVGPRSRARVETGIALGLLERGDRRGADAAIARTEGQAAKLEESAGRRAVWEAILEARAVAGDREGVLKAARTITASFPEDAKDYRRHFSRIRIAAAEARLGDVEAAMAMLRDLKGYTFEYGLVAILKAQCDRKDFAGAETTAGRLKRPFKRAEALVTIGRVSRDAGFLKKAIEIARTAEVVPGSRWDENGDSNLRAGILMDLEELLPELGEIDLAAHLPFVLRGKDPVWVTGLSYGRTAEHHGKRAPLTEVLAWARKIENPHHKACALVGAVTGTLKRRETR